MGPSTVHFVIVTLIFCKILTVTLTATRAEQSVKYDSRYDNVDLDEILKSKRLFDNYIKCLLYDGVCTPDGKMLKDNIPDAIESRCKKCTDKQRFGSEKVIRFIIDNRPDDWKQMEAKYDPEGKYKKEYLEEKKHNETQAAAEGQNDNVKN